MCGIVGYLTINNKIDLATSLDMLYHRGPDAKGEFYYNKGNINIGLGHRRLSIIDISVEANQPMQYQDSGIVIIFNGEIYNFKKLKSDLLHKGYEFTTSSDTEVLACMYKAYGVNMVEKIDGIFSYCILDLNNNFLFLVRDPLGVKPLYISYGSDYIFFASEIKALKSIPCLDISIDIDCLTEFLLNGFLYEPDTGYKHVKKLKPGYYLLFKFDNDNPLSYDEVRFWKPAKKEFTFSIEKEIEESVKAQTVSDVPLGVFFSGGVDSSLILNTLRDSVQSFIIKSSDIDYEEAGMTNDYNYAVKIAKTFKSTLKSIDLSDSNLFKGKSFLDLIDELSILTEEPLADLTFFSSQLLSRRVKELGYTVMLSGMGADEIFAGYPRYRMIKYETLFRKLAWIINRLFSKNLYFQKKVDRFNSFLREDNFIFKYTSLVGVFSTIEVNRLLKNNSNLQAFRSKLEDILYGYSDQTNLKKAMVLDHMGFLSHNFSIADKSSMKESVELRVPLATAKLFDIGFNLSDNKLIGLFKGKKPLRKILYKVLTKGIVDRRKAGFNPPMDKSIREIGLENCYNYMNNNGLFDLLDSELIREILTSHFNKEANNTFKVFVLLYLSAWIKNNNIN